MTQFHLYFLGESQKVRQSDRSHMSVTCLAQVCICCRPWPKTFSEKTSRNSPQLAPERLSAIACCTKRSFPGRPIHRFSFQIHFKIFQNFATLSSSFTLRSSSIYTDKDGYKLHRFQIWILSSSLLGIYKSQISFGGCPRHLPDCLPCRKITENFTLARLSIGWTSIFQNVKNQQKITNRCQPGCHFLKQS